MVESNSIDSSLSRTGRVGVGLLMFDGLRISEENNPKKAEVSLFKLFMSKTSFELKYFR